MLGDNSSAIDQGKGFIDIPQALYLLENTAVRKRLPSIGKTSNKVARNIRKQGYRAITGDAEAIIENLMAGQVKHFFVKTTRRTESLQVTLRNIQPALDPADQNAVLGDGLLVTIVDAPTSFSWLRTQFYVYDDVTIPINKTPRGIGADCRDGRLDQRGSRLCGDPNYPTDDHNPDADGERSYPSSRRLSDGRRGRTAERVPARNNADMEVQLGLIPNE